MLITNTSQYNQLKSEIENYSNFIILPIFNNHLLHPYKSDLLLLYIGILDNDYNVINKYILNINHTDIIYKCFINELNFRTKNIYTNSKKSLLFFLKCTNVYELKIIDNIGAIDSKKQRLYSSIFNQYQYKKIYNKIIPLTHHISLLELEFTYYYDLLKNNIDRIYNKDFLFYNNIISSIYKIEKEGIFIDNKLFKEINKDKIQYHLKDSSDNFIYCDYNIYTSTGRPSNSYGKINFNALNKKTNEREIIISRYKKDGLLVEFDYSAYHLSILADLVNYTFPNDIKNIHDYLGKQYFNVEELTEEQYKDTKTLNFQFLYGGIPDDIINNIDYFKLVNIYLQQLYKEYLNNGYIVSPISNRKIDNVENHNSNKVLNYLLQMLETEITTSNINRVIDKIGNRKIHPILYVYDSILFDIHKSELNNIDEIKNILSENNKYKITIKYSETNYKQIK